MSWLCPYCGKIKESEGGYSPPCCGEVHCIDLSEDSSKCPKCGSDDIFTAHHEGSFSIPECTYQCCGECEHQWNHG